MQKKNRNIKARETRSSNRFPEGVIMFTCTDSADVKKVLGVLTIRASIFVQRCKGIYAKLRSRRIINDTPFVFIIYSPSDLVQTYQSDFFTRDDRV